MINIEITKSNLYDLGQVSSLSNKIVSDIKLLDKILLTEPKRFIGFKVNRINRMNEEAKKFIDDIKTNIQYLNMSMRSLSIPDIEINIDERFNLLIDKRNQFEEKLSIMNFTELNELTLENIDYSLEKYK